MQFLSSIVGLMLASLPFVLVVLAWKSARRDVARQVSWRKRMFALALVGTTLAYGWFWIAFLALAPHVRFEIYEKVGWVSQSLSVAFLVLSFAGTGAARFFGVLAAAGVAVLWVSVGFW